MSAISPLAALLGGALTILAPCSVLILPAFFSYAFQSTRALLGRTALFWVGLLIVLVPLGSLIGAAASLVRAHLDIIARIAALLVIMFGVMELFALELPRLRQKARPQRAESDLTSPASIFLLGVSYAVAGIGCAGPILGAVLVTAGFEASPLRGGFLMVLYATGMALPLFALAALWKAARLSQRSWLRPRPISVFGRPSTLTNLVSGLVLVILGFLLFFSGASNPFSGLVSSARLIAWEEAIMRVGSLVPAWALLLAFAAILGAIWFARPRTLSSHEDAPTSKDTSVDTTRR